MLSIGIIAEYNPLHNGHLYHINKIKEKYPDHTLILVLNGYFLERGEISIQTKEDKTKLALDNNIDLVLELPTLFGTQSADIFANTAIKILNEFKVEKIIFGSEINDPQKLINIAKKQLETNFNDDVKTHFKTGINYPTALAKALNINFEYTPNDLLGISYAKAIIKNNYNIEIETIKRTNDYHDLKSNESIISASNIREKIKKNIDIKNYLPKSSKEKIIKLDNQKLFEILKYKIITEDNLDKYLDVSEGIDYLIKKEIVKVNSIEELIKKIKSKRYTYNKINRMLTHILLGIKKDDAKKDLEYITILGFNDKGKKYLNTIKKDISIPTNKNFNSIQYKIETNSSIIYDLITKEKTYEFETKNKPLKK